MDQDSMIIIEVYVDDIIFGSDDDKMSHKFPRIYKVSLKCPYLGS